MAKLNRTDLAEAHTLTMKAFEFARNLPTLHAVCRGMPGAVPPYEHHAIQQGKALQAAEEAVRKVQTYLRSMPSRLETKCRKLIQPSAHEAALQATRQLHLEFSPMSAGPWKNPFAPSDLDALPSLMEQEFARVELHFCDGERVPGVIHIPHSTAKRSQRGRPVDLQLMQKHACFYSEYKQSGLNFAEFMKAKGMRLQNVKSYFDKCRKAYHRLQTSRDINRRQVR